MNEQNQWYVTIEGNAVGPVSTDLVVRGIKHKKIATNAYVCVVGASEWQLLTDVEEFYAALCEDGLAEGVPHNGYHHEGVHGFDPAERAHAGESEGLAPDPEESEATGSFPSQRSPALGYAAGAEHDAGETAQTADAANGGAAAQPPEAHADAGAAEVNEMHPNTQADGNALLDSEKSAGNGAPRNGKHIEAVHETRPALPSVDLDIDITVDESSTPSVDWNHGFTAYFLVDSDITLPEEQALLHSLASEPKDTFLQDEAMWNLALCLAFGTDPVAAAAASVFFDAVTAHGLYERIEWMCRTLLSRGFMPSGIPHAAGYRGVSYLQRVCPPGLLPKLEAEAAS